MAELSQRGRSCDLPKEQGLSQVMRWNDIVLLLVRAKTQKPYVIPAHYLGKCPNSAQTKHTTGVRAYLGPWQWNTCSLVLYVVSHVVAR